MKIKTYCSLIPLMKWDDTEDDTVNRLILLAKLFPVEYHNLMRNEAINR